MLEFEQILNKIGFYPKKYRDSWSYQGRTVEFFGLGDKTKGESSSNRVIGAGRDFLYVTEVDKITSETFRQLEVRTKEFVILDFNPTKPKPWIRTEIEEERKARLKDVEVFVSNYTHNPFLTKPQIAAIEYQRETNPNWFKAMGLGEYSDAEFLIFPNVHIIADEDFKPSSKNRFYGIDFGFSDPQTVIEVYEKENQIYINQVSYEQNQTIDQLLEVIHTRCDKKGLFVCDSSRPDSIQYLQNKKVAAIASKKGQGSILSGIAGIQTYSKINITVSSKETIEEFKNYSLLENDRPQDGNDHAIDPVRYVWLTCFSKGMRPILFG
jgi:phage terminase large subunit